MSIMDVLTAPIPTFSVWTSIAIGGASLILAILLHELAHYAQLKKYKITPSIHWKGGIVLRWDKDMINNEQTMRVYYSGIIAGMLPIIMLLFVDITVFLVVLFLYGVASWYDLKELNEIEGDHAKILLSYLDKKLGIALILGVIAIMILSAQVPTYRPEVTITNFTNLSNFSFAMVQ